MIVITKIAPRNSLLFIAGAPDEGESPEVTGIGLVWSTPSCVAIGTRMEDDGETSVMLSDEAHADSADLGLRRVFDGSIHTPKKEIWVSTVTGEGVLSLPVPMITSRIEIWANDITEPDKLLILVRRSLEHDRT
jgi:hypothetical protein